MQAGGWGVLWSCTPISVTPPNLNLVHTLSKPFICHLQVVSHGTIAYIEGIAYIYCRCCHKGCRMQDEKYIGLHKTVTYLEYIQYPVDNTYNNMLIFILKFFNQVIRLAQK